MRRRVWGGAAVLLALMAFRRTSADHPTVIPAIRDSRVHEQAPLEPNSDYHSPADPLPPARKATHILSVTDVPFHREVRNRVACLLELAMMAFDQKKLDQCRKLCCEILLIVPGYCIAVEVLQDLERVAAKEEYHAFLKNKSETWMSVMECEGDLPYQESLQYPTQEEWREYAHRVTNCPLTTTEEVLITTWTLDQLRVSLPGEEWPIQGFVESIERAGVPIVLHDLCLPTEAASLGRGEFSIRTVLDLLASRFGWIWSLEEDRFILLSPP